MDKTARIERSRTFLVAGLPEPLTRASAHIQIFDNYIPQTRLRIRSVRDPETAGWTRILQQRSLASDTLACIRIAEMYLSDAEHERLKIFEGSEIRKNRYFHEYDGRTFAFDVFLGNLWGLNMARVELDTIPELESFERPPFAVLEVTNNSFFLGESLVTKKFEDVRAEVARLSELEERGQAA